MSKIKAVRFLSAVLLGCAICGSAVAGFGLPGLGSSSNTAADQMQGKLITDFVAGQISILKSQADIASALGHKDKAAQLTATANALGSGATKEKLSRGFSISEQASTDQSKDIASAKNMSAEAKAEMQKAIPGYLVGVAALVKLRPDCTNFLGSAKQEISSAGFMGAASAESKLAVGTYVATNVPGYLKSLGSTTGSFISYAKSNNIPLPADATGLLGSLN